MKQRIAALAVVLITAFAGAACSGEVSVGSSAVKKAELDKQVAGLYTPDDPADTVEADCAGDLDAKVDATQTCHLSVGEETAEVEVTVSSAEGSDVKFDAVTFLPAAQVADAIMKDLVRQGLDAEDVKCLDDLRGVVGEKVECDVTASDVAQGPVDAEVTSVEGLLVKFDYSSR